MSARICGKPPRKTTLKNNARISYPWLTILLSVLIVCWFLLGQDSNAIAFYGIPLTYLQREYQLFGLAIYAAVVLFDITRFQKTRARYDERLDKHKKQIDDLFQAKRSLQSRAHTYSGHADKLKLFISERLLEYIEYDEKFLHFKNIAAEVRHNGVISFDKVQTALKHAMKNDSDDRYPQALDSMTYLWDLLDLSTTDNIAVHIANKLYECEEHFFQNQLNEHDNLSQPITPTYSPKSALESALMTLLNKNEEIGDSPEALPVDDIYEDARFRIQLTHTDELLGNSNYLVLMMENLASNALFYSSKARYKNALARVAVAMCQHDNNIEISVYNHGPLIEEKHRDKIFQLGFSTRQVRDHHGKGLGLHFVSQIVQGYEGNINYENINNRADTLSIRVLLSDNTVETHVVEIVLDGGRPLAQLAQSADSPAKKLDWIFPSDIREIEVSSQTSGHVSRLHAEAGRDRMELIDSEDWATPRWFIEVQQNKRVTKMLFNALDVSGVRFLVSLPSARSRLEYEDNFFEEAPELTDE